MGKILLEPSPLRKWSSTVTFYNLCKTVVWKSEKGEAFLDFVIRTFVLLNKFTERKQSGIYSSAPE